MIPTFILNPKIKQESFDGVTNLICSFRNEDLLENIIGAIDWSIKYDEDVVYCVIGQTERKVECIPNLEELIYELIEKKVYLYFIDTIHNDEVAIDREKALLSGLTEIKSFILTKPIYEYLKIALTEMRFSNFTLEQLFEIMFPTQITLFPSSEFLVPKSEERICVIAPFRNVSKYLNEFLSSIEKQSYDNYLVYFVDDCSNDGSVNLIPKNSKYIVRKNRKRKFALENILSVLVENSFKDGDIICLIDPDDILSHGYVFNVLNNVYSNSCAMVTYGTMTFKGSPYKFGSAYSREEFEEIRRSIWRVAHLRTFKYRAFRELLTQDPMHNNFKREDGSYLRMPYDMAIMFPLIEICGFKQTKFISTVLYEYRQHDQNDVCIHSDEQREGETIIRSKKKLKEVLFYN